MKRSPSTALRGLLLVAAGVIGLVAAPNGPIAAAPSEDVVVIRDGRRIHIEGEFDSAEFERQLEATLESALSGLDDLEHLEGLDVLGDLEHLDDLGEHIARTLERAFGDLEVHGDFHGHGRLDAHFDSKRFERQMERLSRRLERDLGRLDIYGLSRGVEDVDRDERSLRREIRRLERELEELRDELTRLAEDEEI